MKLIKSSVEILPQEEGLLGAYKQIEIAARTCYKSEDKICEGSAKKMIDFLIGRGHFSPLEHGTIYLHFSYYSPIHDINYMKLVNVRMFYEKNPYSKVVIKSDDHYKMDVYITTNCRVITEHDRQDDLQYMCEPTKYHKKRVTIKAICDRGVTHEWVRHRTESFCQESTRYCNYSKDKFGMSVTFIQPSWVKEEHQEEFEEDCALFESLYFKWLNKGYIPQYARYFLNTGVKTELVATAFIDDWKHFFDLRCSTAAHPDIKVLADDLLSQFTEAKLI